MRVPFPAAEAHAQSLLTMTSPRSEMMQKLLQEKHVSVMASPRGSLGCCPLAAPTRPTHAPASSPSPRARDATAGPCGAGCRG